MTPRQERECPQFDLRTLFDEERFPNVLVCLDGTVLATWGRDNVVVRRSEDGGETWGEPIEVGPGMHGGGATVDETTGDVLVFAIPGKEDATDAATSAAMYRSRDNGLTWSVEPAVFHADSNGNVPALHMHEHGITLRHGPHAGRLLRAARVYGQADGYNTAFYSDDHGRTWHASEPFPVMGTGEAAVAELRDGRVLYSSRRHWFADDEPWTSGRLQAYSEDGGRTFGQATLSSLPDGPRYRGRERREACYNGHFGMEAGLVRLPVSDRDVLLYSNADQEGHERTHMTVWASHDGGATWPVKRLVHAGASAYSSLAAGRPGTAGEGWVYLQFEQHHGPGSLARFNLAWVLEGSDGGNG